MQQVDGGVRCTQVNDVNYVKLLKSFFHCLIANSFNLQTRRRFTCVPVCFSSGVTGLLHLDDSGDRETDFALWDIVDTNSTTFQVNALNTDTTETCWLCPRRLRLSAQRFCDLENIN